MLNLIVRDQRWVLMMKIFTIFLSFILLIGCQATQSVKNSIATERTVLSVKESSFNPQVGSKFAWFGDIVLPEGPVSKENQFLVDTYTNAFNTELRQRGFEIVESVSEADYVIGAAVADGKSAQSEQIMDFFLMYPSLAPRKLGYEKLTTVMGIVSAATHRNKSTEAGQNILWRASLAAYGLDDSFTLDERAFRLQQFADKLMKSLD